MLDDNCTLCLPNGERIKLNPNTMRMLFEVEDLSVASPATVSRCGMVFISLEEMGWRPAVRTWVDQTLANKYPDLSEEMREYIYELFDTHVDPGLKWLAKNGKQFIKVVENNLTTTLACLIQALLRTNRGMKYKGALLCASMDGYHGRPAHAICCPCHCRNDGESMQLCTRACHPRLSVKRGRLNASADGSAYLRCICRPEER